MSLYILEHSRAWLLSNAVNLPANILPYLEELKAQARDGPEERKWNSNHCVVPDSGSRSHRQSLCNTAARARQSVPMRASRAISSFLFFIFPCADPPSRSPPIVRAMSHASWWRDHVELPNPSQISRLAGWGVGHTRRSSSRHPGYPNTSYML